MLDILKRACRHPFDYSGVRRTTTLTFERKIQESDSIYSFIFSAEELPSWQAGQHSIYAFVDKKVDGKSWRPFSVASAPHEKQIRIGTNLPEPHSDFKQKLMELEPGEKIKMHGPFGEFYVRDHMKQIVGVAGGIGITPFRAIIADLSHKKSPVKLTLIYSTKNRKYTYKEELEEWRSQNPNIEIIYTETPDEVNAELSKQVELHHNSAHYFIAGPPGMISALKSGLKEKAIRNVVNDPFKGY